MPNSNAFSATAPDLKSAGVSGQDTVDEQGNKFVNACCRYAVIVTPSSNNIALGPCNAIAVDTSNATVTGILADDTVSYTTPPLVAGIPVAFAFKRITAVSVGNVHALWYRKPAS